HFGGADAVAGNIDDIIDATGDPVIAILVAASTVAGEVIARVGFEIGFHMALVIAPDRAGLAWPAGFQRQHTAANAIYFLALVVQQYRLDAEERSGRRAGFEVSCAGQWSDHHCAGFGLPPGIHDRAATVAHNPEVPFPGFRIDRLASGGEQAQAAARRALYRFVTFAHQCANRSGGCIENVHLMLIYDLPEPRSIRIIWNAFIHEGGCAVGQRAVNGVAVASDPANIRRAPV